MAAPLFFLPGTVDLVSLFDGGAARESGEELLAKHHLDRVFADVKRRDQVGGGTLSGRGPGGKAGSILCAQPPHGRMPRRLGYYPEEQVWQPAAEGLEDLLWVGIDPSEPPTAEDLARDQQVAGQWLELGYGGRWMIPTLRRVDNSTELPRDVVFDAQRKPTFRVRQAYLDEWVASGRTLRLFYPQPDEPTLTIGEAAERALAILTINYRLDWFLQNRFQVLDAESNVVVLGASIDYPVVEQILAELAAQKKTPQPRSPATASISPGSPDSCPTIDPAAGSCSSPPVESADPIPS